MGLSDTSVGMNSLLLTPRFSGVVFGFANTFGCIGALLSPILTSAVTNAASTKVQYRLVMGASTILILFLCVFYNIFATTQVFGFP